MSGLFYVIKNLSFYLTNDKIFIIIFSTNGGKVRGGSSKGVSSVRGSKKNFIILKEEGIMASDIKKLSEIRNKEFAAAKKQAANALEEYWAGSITTSIMRDYRAGRVRQRKVGR